MRIVALETVTEFILDGTHGSPERTTGGVPVLSAQNVTNEGLNYHTNRLTSRAEYEAFNKRVRLAVGDLLMTIVGTIGRATVVTEVHPLVFQRSVSIIRPKRSELDPRYFLHAVRDAAFQRQLASATNTSTQAGVYLGKIKKCVIPLPPLDEQRRIAAILDQADALRRKRRDSKILNAKLIPSIFEAMFGDIVANTMRWPAGRVGDIVSHFESGKSIVADDDDAGASLNRVLKVSAVTTFRFDPSASKPLPSDYDVPPHHLVQRGDLLFSRANTTELIGATALVDTPCKNLALSDKLWRFRWPNGYRPAPLFVWQLFAQPAFRLQIQQRASGTSGSMKNISQDKVLGIEIGIPPRELQALFANRVAAILNLERGLVAQLNHLDSLFTSLQHRAFNGEL